MQSNQNNKSDKPKFLDTKILIGAIAVAVTVGFWNLFSNNAFAAEKTSPSVVITLPPQAPSYSGDNLPPLPTLVPLVDVTFLQYGAGLQTSNVSQTGISLIAQPQNSSSLRVVGVPTRVITQKQKPVIGAQISPAQASDNSSGSSSGGGSSSKSSSTTKSSKK